MTKDDYLEPPVRVVEQYSRRAVIAGSLGAWQIGAGSPVHLPKRIRLAIIGFEGHTGEILDVLPRLPDVSLAAICDADPKVLEAQARGPGLAKAKPYANRTQMLEQESLDVVAVCNDNGGRAAAILDCLAHGAHVIAEKPLALENGDLQAIRQAAHQQGRQVGMLLPMRFEPVYMQMKKAVTEGLVGEVIAVDAQKSYKAGRREEWYLHRSTYGGTIPWVGVHMIDLMRFVGGREFREVSAFAANVAAPNLGEMENVAGAVFRLDNGGVATLRLDYCRPDSARSHGDDRLRIAGTRGVLEYQMSTGTVLLGPPGQHLPSLPKPGSVFVDFLESVYNGKAPQLSTEEIFRVNEITLAAQQAADQRRMIVI